MLCLQNVDGFQAVVTESCIWCKFGVLLISILWIVLMDIVKFVCVKLTIVATLRDELLCNKHFCTRKKEKKTLLLTSYIPWWCLLCTFGSGGGAATFFNTQKSQIRLYKFWSHEYIHISLYDDIRPLCRTLSTGETCANLLGTQSKGGWNYIKGRLPSPPQLMHWICVCYIIHWAAALLSKHPYLIMPYCLN